MRKKIIIDSYSQAMEKVHLLSWQQHDWEEWTETVEEDIYFPQKHNWYFLFKMSLRATTEQ